MPHTSTANATRQGRLAEAILHFTPNWFTASMGTGILSAALGQFPGVKPVFHAGEALFFVNIALFMTLSALYLAKWIFHPQVARRIFDHPVLSMFLGAIPMALATLINGLLIYGPQHFGDTVIADVALALWVGDAILALCAGIAVPYFMFTRQTHVIAEMSAVWLLPIVAAEVAAASGALLLAHIGDGALKLDILVAVLVLWACSVPLALSVLVILFLRMALHKLPSATMAATSWLALGPIGTGAMVLALVALNGPDALAANGLGVYASAFAATAIIGALLLWGYGLWWLAAALVVTLRQIREGLPFNLGWWAYTFPLGVYALATLKIGALLPVGLFPMAGAVLVAVLAVIWTLVAGRTLAGVVFGHMFADPCVKAA